MLLRLFLFVAGALTAGVACACDEVILQQYHDSARIVDTLHVEKNGQARVFAVDGTEVTAGQALWMQGQLRKVAGLCAVDSPLNQAKAQESLTSVQELLRSHQHRF